MKRVEVLWKDIKQDGGWHEPDELDKFIHEDNTVRQVGFIYESDDEQIILLDSYFLDKQLFGGIHKIPQGCIISITEI